MKMKKIFQRLVDAGKGYCMKCTIATLLGLEYEDVPHFLEFENPISEMVDFMAEKGLEYEGCLYNYPKSEYSTINKLKNSDGINGLFYASVFSPKYFKKEDGPEAYQITHAVLINKNYEIVFDPNLDYQNINSYPASDYLGFNGINNVYLFKPKT